MAEVTLRNVVKAYGTTEVIHGIDLEIRSGELVVVRAIQLRGKPRCCAWSADSSATGGEIVIGGAVVNHLPPRAARDIAMVFQDYALYPHKSVYENMAFDSSCANFPSTR